MSSSLQVPFLSSLVVLLKWPRVAPPNWGKATVDDKPFVFNELIAGLSQVERIQLASSLQLLPKIENRDFDQYGLLAYDKYADLARDVTKDKTLRPKTFNEVSADVIKTAITAKRFSEESCIYPLAIKNGLLWVSRSSLKYPFSDPENINYHETVQWVAGKKGLDTDQIKALPTFELERKIVEKYFADIWDKLTTEQREALLTKIEKETHPAKHYRIDIHAANTTDAPVNEPISVHPSERGGWSGKTECLHWRRRKPLWRR